MTDSQIEQLVAAVRALSPEERLRVAQRVIDRMRVVREAASSSAPASEEHAPAMLGLFADELDLVDEVTRHVYTVRSAIRQLPR